MIAATSGPRGFGPLVRPQIKPTTHGYQDRANASTKNAINLCRLKKVFMVSRSARAPSRGSANEPDEAEHQSRSLSPQLPMVDLVCVSFSADWCDGALALNGTSLP